MAMWDRMRHLSSVVRSKEVSFEAASYAESLGKVMGVRVLILKKRSARKNWTG